MSTVVLEEPSYTLVMLFLCIFSFASFSDEDVIH